MDALTEKRCSPRTDLPQVVPFERAADESQPSGDGPARAVGRDISPEGASLLTDCPLERGEVLRLHLPREAVRAGAPVLSEVRWTQPTRHGFRVGLQFLA